jgi:hypothetical protein
MDFKPFLAGLHSLANFAKLIDKDGPSRPASRTTSHPDNDDTNLHGEEDC